MDPDQIQLIVNLLFLIVIGFLALISLLAIYIFIRYGRTRPLTVLISLVFAGVFALGAMAAFLNLQTLF